MPDGTLCEDGSSCTFADRCVAGTCVGVPAADGVACTDGDTCTVNDRCSAGRCVGTAADAAIGCRAPDAGGDAAGDAVSDTAPDARADAPASVQQTDAAGDARAVDADPPDAPLRGVGVDAARDGAGVEVGADARPDTGMGDAGTARPGDAANATAADRPSAKDAPTADGGDADGALKPSSGPVDAQGTASPARYRPEGGACACAAPGGAPMSASALFFVVGAGLMALMLGRLGAVPVRARRRPRR